MKPKLIGLVGLAGAGKNTAADVFIRAGYQDVAFADEIKRIARQMGWTGEKTGTGRELLQNIGMAGRAYDPNVWINIVKWCNPIRFGAPTVITDVRFQNEADWIKRAGGLLIRIVRPSIEQGTHASETEQNSIQVDGSVINDGSVAELHIRIEKLLNETI
jgi:hypothetical protein